MPSTSTLFSAYASITASVMLVRSIVNELVPPQLQTQLLSKFQYLFNPLSPQLTLVIEEYDGLDRNEVYEASELFLRTIITPSIDRIKVTKVSDKNLAFSIDKGEEVIHVFEGIQVKWKLIISEVTKPDGVDPYAPMQKTENRMFELKFHKKHKDQVMSSYLAYVLNSAKANKEENKVVKLHTTGAFYGQSGLWGSIILEHPATFDTLAMDQKLKREIIDDLDRFVKRREFYKRVGKAWKRGYLLYGPPGTGKSSLIAAMANYLKFDVYDMELANIMNNMQLRNFLVATANRSILVIEDIDCSVDLQNREQEPRVRNEYQDPDNKLTLSGLLNFIDGLWSSCGDERIIIFTTNHRERLDPALLRPGRMDMHIHLSYCTIDGFNMLASNYLGIHKNNHNKLYSEIEDSIEKSLVTPAEVAEELMKSEDADTALGGLLEVLKRKKREEDEPIKDKEECQEPKIQKTVGQDVEGIARTRGRRVYRGRVFRGR
ncbi:Aaa-atpase [Thalictrum thalictroides]|uniref:Aaa-atpase n=1 Tax=Thalictrum thalictroides TaxID=46969 RepID=A0A7J6V6W0_THATH|nr:Aaa-atpase [Thalictrum thalictroides]